MPLVLPTPQSTWSSQDVTLAGRDYTFEYRYNTRDKRWRVDIYSEETPVVLGLKIMENQSLLSNYRLPLFDHGDIYCLRSKDDGLPVGRYNLGQDRAYSLLYYTNEELAAI